MKKGNETHQPVRQSVLVDCPPDEAFRLFTEGFAEWWPLAAYSESGDDSASCHIEPWPEGRVFERTRDGEEVEWGSVVTWDPPHRVEFTWNPGGTEDPRQNVSVEFQVEADGTRVTLIHSGWQLAGVGVALARFAAFAAPVCV